MNQGINQLLQNEYSIRLNRVIDYINNNYDEDLNLALLAQIACFSKYHFHRLFHALMGETLNDYVHRIRLEKSVHKLINETNKSITEIAYDCGFSCSQNYAKAFKAYYGIVPSTVRKELNWEEIKINVKNILERRKSNSHSAGYYFNNIHRDQYELFINNISRKQAILQMDIRNLPDMRVAYIRTRGPYTWDKIRPSFIKLYKWAASKGLINENSIMMDVIRKNPAITPADKLIHDACITVSDSVKEDKWINVQTLPGGKIAVCPTKTKIDHVDEAWGKIILNWLVFSDYQPDDRPLYQIHRNDFMAPDLKNHLLDLYFPIKSLYE